MNHKYELKKPYTDIERSDFIVEWNHRNGLVITEDENGIYADDPILPSVEEQNEEIKKQRAVQYAQIVDPLVAEYTRKATCNLFEEGEEAALKAKIIEEAQKIKDENPYVS